MSFNKVLTFALFAFAVQTAYAAPVPKLGTFCPTGYRPHDSSGYCLPSSPAAPMVVRKLSTFCPNGYRAHDSSGYCISSSVLGPDVVIKLKVFCPTGYRVDGSSGYCSAN